MTYNGGNLSRHGECVCLLSVAVESQTVKYDKTTGWIEDLYIQEVQKGEG